MDKLNGNIITYEKKSGNNNKRKKKKRVFCNSIFLIYSKILGFGTTLGWI